MTQKSKTETSQQFTFDTWTQLINEQLERIETFTGEAARYEKQGLAQANGAIDELAKLMKDSVDYTCKISAEWRKAAMEATQQANQMFKKNLAN